MLAFVDIKTKVPSQYRLLILKLNFQFDVNKSLVNLTGHPVRMLMFWSPTILRVMKAMPHRLVIEPTVANVTSLEVFGRIYDEGERLGCWNTVETGYSRNRI